MQAVLPLKTVRGLLLLRGYTLQDWSEEHGYSNAFVHMSLTGKKRGPKALRIVDELRTELGI
ncbi:MAG: hypothetical protein HQ559_01115 [Lentisphaerae bacterium]|nr:hypothetical protein [Lentisphaerota bacterium]